MPRVFVNGISAKAGGGRSILSNFLKAANAGCDDFNYVVAVGDVESWREFAGSRVKFIDIGRWSATVLVPLASFLLLPRIAQQSGCDLVFNPGDIPIRTRLPQIFLFDWPYAAYPESEAWALSGRYELLVRTAKLWIFRRFLNQIDLMIAQSAALAQHLQLLYDLPKVEIIPNAVSLENLGGGEPRDFGMGSGFKLLCLSRYYSHKNIEVFIPVARRMRQLGLNAKIITTLSRQESKGAKDFLDAIDGEGLSDIVMNVGSVPMSQVPSLYQQVDALILPTFLESFSGTYVEAMHHKIPILTSDLDFARGVCGDGAFYFNPSDEAQIVDVITNAIENPALCASKVAIASNILAGMPDWPTAYRLFTDKFRLEVGNNR